MFLCLKIQKFSVQVNCWKHQIQVLVKPKNKKMLNYTLNNNVDAIWWKCLLSFTQSVQIFTMLFPSYILKTYILYVLFFTFECTFYVPVQCTISPVAVLSC
jgi:hypothetical protein